MPAGDGMRVAILGVTTGLGSRIAAALLARGATPVGLIRRAGHAGPLRAAGVEPVLLDPDSREVDVQLRQAALGADAIVLAAGTGTGPGSLGSASSSPAAQLASAAEAVGVRRFVFVSAHLPGERDRVKLGDLLDAYLAEKSAAEHVLRHRGLDWCVLRPGTLTDDPPTGSIRVRRDRVPSVGDQISRADCAEAVCAVLAQEIRGVWLVTAGATPIDTAFHG